MNRNYRRNSVSRTFKDYLVPIIGLVLVFVLIYSFFSGDSNDTTITDGENRVGYALNFGDIETEAFIEYTGGKKEKVENTTKIFKGEKLIVKEGDVSFQVGETTKLHVDKIGEVKINNDGSYTLFASNMWISSSDALQINTRYAKIKASANSVLSLSQNEVSSTIYVLRGTAEVKNLGGQATLLGSSQKISVSQADASKEDIDLSLSKMELDSFFMKSDWFLKNNGPVIIASTKNNEKSGTGTSSETELVNSISQSGLLKIENLEDESTITTETIDIKGSFLNGDISQIIISGKKATINTQDKTFEIKAVSTKQKENDIIIKIYNDSQEVLGKQVYTVYYNYGIAPANEPLFKVENYSLDATEFQFISPKQNPYTTDAGVVMIEGRVPAGIVKQISINGYVLRKFPQYGTYWAYFANEEFGNLKTGLNVYKVDYIGKDGESLHSNAFTIVKNKAKPVQVEPVVTEKVMSDEASPVS